jgi:hypothetical protein
LRDKAPAFVTALFGIEALDGFSRSGGVVGENERQGDISR